LVDVDQSRHGSHPVLPDIEAWRGSGRAARAKTYITRSDWSD